MYGDVHRFEGYGEATADFAFTESPYSARRSRARRSSIRTPAATASPYLVFRFSNVYGRYDNDLHRMVRVLPLFIHRCSRGEPITVFGGDDKVLDFTYVDDCVDGIARGVEALAAGRVANETINLAFGARQHAVPRGRADRGRARRRAADDDRAVALGEVTRYVADIRKARDLLGWTPKVPLDEGIPRAVAWFPRASRRASPRRTGRSLNEGDSVGSQDARNPIPPRVLAIFGPTASGKTAVAEAIAERIPGRARSPPTRCRSTAGCRSY